MPKSRPSGSPTPPTACLAACWESTSETDRDERLKQALMQVENKFKDLPVEQLEAEGKQQLQKAGCPKPFHWPLEFPEVFMERGDLMGFVGNPPFMGGQKITGTLERRIGIILLNKLRAVSEAVPTYVPISSCVPSVY